VCKLDAILRIADWAANNQTMIQHLLKKNIISYTNKSSIADLKKEITGLNMLSETRHIIDRFNTAQRELLKKALMKEDGISANKSDELKEWHKRLLAMNNLPQYKIDKLISTASALYSLEELKEHVENALQKSYDWNKEDMLAFLRNHAKDTDIVYDKDNLVVTRMHSFDSCRALCGGGRTGWCLTREQRYFNQYVSDEKGNKQYFVFDFSKKEDNNLAHIGITVNKERGITAAHCTNNNSLLGCGIADEKGKNVDLYKALSLANVPFKLFIKMKPLNIYKWNSKSILNFISDKEGKYALSYANDHVIVLNILCSEGAQEFCGHTYIPEKYMSPSTETKVYVIVNLDKHYDDTNSLICILIDKDKYGVGTVSGGVGNFNNNVNVEEELKEIGITVSDFYNREEIDHRILLHKLIDEGDEKGAIELIDKEGEDFDVNYVFSGVTPIFSAIQSKRMDVIMKLLKHPKLNTSTKDPFHTCILSCLIYEYKSSSEPSEEKDKKYEEAISYIINDERFDLNICDINNDTPLHVACEYPKYKWVAEKLIKSPRVNVNILSDLNTTPITNAIRRNNKEIMMLLGMRKDLLLRDYDHELAKANNIDLEKYIKPVDLGFAVKKPKPIKVDADFEMRASKLSKIFTQYFQNRE
jgi:hypothetical protein